MLRVTGLEPTVRGTVAPRDEVEPVRRKILSDLDHAVFHTKKGSNGAFTSQRQNKTRTPVENHIVLMRDGIPDDAWLDMDGIRATLSETFHEIADEITRRLPVIDNCADAHLFPVFTHDVEDSRSRRYFSPELFVVLVRITKPISTISHSKPSLLFTAGRISLGVLWGNRYLFMWVQVADLKGGEK